MTNSRLLLARFALAALLLAAASAHAQVFRAYLSPTGNDNNPCTLQQPCRLLPAALAAVASGGEIWITGSANYNTETVNISKSVTIVAVPGALGSVIAIGGPAIRINTASLLVALRNVVVAQLAGGGGTNGVEVTAGSQVQIDRSLIVNLPQNGVTASGGGSVRIVDSIVRDNGAWGVLVADGGNVSVSTSQLIGNGLGGISTLATVSTGSPGTRAMVTDSLISGGLDGARAVSTGDGLSRITVTRSTIDRASTAVTGSGSGSGPAYVVLSRSMVVNNGIAWKVEGTSGSIQTNSNNHITDNGLGIGPLTSFAPL
jgi:hypothetical protein